MKQQENKDDGFSLVMSLIFISLLSVLVVGFLTSMRVEVFSSDAHLQSAKATSYAQAGTDMALAQLKYATGGATGLLFWASQPGKIVMATRSSTTSTFNALQVVNLHSGAGTYNESSDISADLNQGTKYLVTSATDQLRIKWIYVLKDGTVTTSVPTYVATNTNPPVGRFAYWVDDESARINLNTANTRNTTNPLGSPSQVDLKVFGSTVTDTVINNINAFRSGTSSGQHYFNTVAEVQTASSVMGSVINSDRFSLTVNSQSPDLNMFGEPRIVLTTQKSLAGNAPFLDVLAVDDTDPGPWANLDGTTSNPPSATSKVNKTVAMLVKVLTRKDWPVLPGKAFTDKYKASSTASAIQIAVNIIDYVRCKESTEQLVAPIRGQTTGGVFTFDGRNGTVMGVTRAPRITERSYVQLDSTNAATVTTNRRIKITYEIHLPQYSNVYNLDLTKFWISYYLGGIPGSGGTSPLWAYPAGAAATAANSYVSGSASITLASVVTGSATISAGSFSQVTVIADKELKYNGTNTKANVLAFDGGSSGIISDPPTGANDYYRWEFLQGGANIPAGPTVNETNAQSSEVNDPMVNKAVADWVLAAAPTWGTFSSTINTLNKAIYSAGVPQQDVMGGNVTNIGIQVPAPAGTVTNSSGVVDSVAELGYIHTGIETTTFGTPWRTLRLQPKTDATVLPDWLLLDAFTAPKKKWENPTNSPRVAVPASFSYYTMPSQATSTVSVNQRVGGLINANATLSPVFRNASGAITRTASLRAVLSTVYDNSISANPATTISTPVSLVNNIVNMTTASNGVIWNSTTSPTFVTRGQIAEISGMTDSGEQSENKLRGVVDLLTTQGSVFRVYAIGQSIRQQSATSIAVMGEKRTMTVIERSTDVTGTNVQFKTIYSGKPY